MNCPGTREPAPTVVQTPAQTLSRRCRRSSRSAASMTPQRLLLLLAASSCAAATSTAASSTITTTATSTTSSASLSLTATALAGIVQEAEPCVYLCYDAACIDKDCDAGDFSCICANPNSLVVELGICVGNYCDGSQSFGTFSCPPPPLPRPLSLLTCQTLATGWLISAMPTTKTRRAPRSPQLRPLSCRRSRKHRPRRPIIPSPPRP